MPRLSIHLFGPFQTYLEGKLLENFKSDKARALLAYLAVEAQQPHSRVKLACLLWPEMPDTEALANLRFTLSSLRKTLKDRQSPQPVLSVGRETLQLNPLSDVWVDVAFFEQQIAGAAELNPLQAMPYLTAAMQSFQGRFMEGFYLSDCLKFDDWLWLRQEKLNTQALGMLHTLVEFYEGRRQWENALTYTQQALALAPWDEGLHQKAMRLFAQLKNPAAAWAQYQTCKRMLAQEMQLVPSPETDALAQRIRAGERPRLHPGPIPAPLAVGKRICVAREDELAHLQNGLRASITGQGQIIFISGGAGSGKTTLLDYFLSHALVSHPDLLAAWGDCSALSETFSLPFEPFRDMLESLTGEFATQRATGLFVPEYAQRIWSALPQICQILVERAPDLVGTLLPDADLQQRIEAFTMPGAPWRLRLQEIVAQREAQSPVSQEHLLAQITRLLQVLSDLHPLVLIFDDLQWADQASLNLLYHLGQRLQHHRVLLLGAYRPAMKSTQSLSLLQVVRELQRRTGNAPVDLDQCDGEAFIEAWLDIQDYQVDESFRSNLYQQTGGQALFTVDTLRAMQESQNLIQVESGSWVATPSLDWQRIPSRVDAILASEFARFPLETRSLLEIASLSDDGSVANVISMVSEIDEERVKSLLATLPGETQAWLQPQAPAIFHGQFGPVYHFRHRLYQDFVIQQISPAKRSTLHRKLAEALIDFYQAEPDAVASKIAYHFEQAGQFELAVPYLLQAAHHASSLSAHEYSIALLTHALEILSMLPPSSERDASELKVLNALSGQLLGGKGWGSEERLYATQRAYELCQQVGEATASQFLLTLFSLADMARARGQHAQSLALGQQMLQVARKRGDQEYLALTYWTLGASYFFQGNLSEARRNLEEVLSLHIPKASGLMTITGTDASVVSLCWLSWAYFLEGHHEKARSSGSAAVALANQIKHPFNQVFALTFGECGLHALCGDWEGVLTSLKTLLPLVEVDDLAPMLPWALVFQGWAQTMSGSSTDGIEHIHTGMNAWREAGAVSGLTCMGYYLADACLQVGRYREARMAVDKTLALVNKTDERLFEARLLRIRKALLHLDADV